MKLEISVTAPAIRTAQSEPVPLNSTLSRPRLNVVARAIINRPVLISGQFIGDAYPLQSERDKDIREETAVSKAPIRPARSDADDRAASNDALRAETALGRNLDQPC
jgi:hypothetical protein